MIKSIIANIISSIIIAAVALLAKWLFRRSKRIPDQVRLLLQNNHEKREVKRIAKLTRIIAEMDRYDKSPSKLVARICMLFSLAAFEGIPFLLNVIPAVADSIVRRLSPMSATHHIDAHPISSAFVLLISLTFTVLFLAMALQVSERSAHYARNREWLKSKVSTIFQKRGIDKTGADDLVESMVKAWSAID